MTRTKWATRIATMALAPTLALSLSGCANPLDSLAGKLPELPRLPQGPTVKEALEQEAASVKPAVGDSSLHTPGTLTVGVSTSSSAPMVVSSQEGAYSGYDVDVAAAIASELGLSVSYVPVSGPTDAASAQCDVVMGAVAGDTGSVAVVGDYAERATAFFHKGDQTTASPQDLAGKRVGVQDGSASQQLLKRSNLQVTQQTFSNLNDAFAELENGTVDYVLCDALAGGYLQGGYSDISVAGTIDAPSSVGVAVTGTNAELQQAVKTALDKVSSNGVGEVIRGKWLGGMDRLDQASQVQGITMSAGTVEGASETATSTTGSAHDGSTAGANAADVVG